MKSDESVSGQRVAKETPPSPPKPRKQSGDRDNYNASVVDSFYQPIITVKALADHFAGSMSEGGVADPKVAAQIEQGLLAEYPSGMVSMAQANNEMYIVDEFSRRKAEGSLRTKDDYAQLRAAMDAIRGEGKELSGTEALSRGVDPSGQNAPIYPDHELNTARVLYGDIEGASESDLRRAEALLGLAQEHARGGKHALYGGRPQEEDDRLHAAYGDDAYHRVTPDMQRNLDAQRVVDLISAQGNNYQPDSGMAQTARLVGGTFGPPVNLVREFTTEPGAFFGGNVGKNLGDFVDFTFNPDARYGYASQMYNQGRAEQGTPNESNVYTSDHDPKYLFADPNTQTGLANVMTENTSYPMARGYNSQLATAMAETPSRYWQWLNNGQEAYGSLREAQNTLRQTGMQTNPVIPDGASAEDAQRLQGQLKDADNKMAGWKDAFWGPALSDYTNFVNRLQGRTGAVPRTLPSPAASSVLGMPEELVRDPTNWAFNGLSAGAGVMRAGVKGGMKSAAKELAKQVVRQPLKLADDTVQEGAEDAGIASAFLGPLDMIRPLDHNNHPNLLMGSQDPNSPTYDRDREIATNAAMNQRDDAGKQLQRLQSARANQPRYQRMER